MGNPPFVGRRYRNALQVADIAKFFTYKDVDYVACWYKKAADFIQGTKIESAFVSTNSITQGEQVAAIFENLPITINFAYKTFHWDSESNSKAHVHCVIIGFANFARTQKFIFDGNKKILAKNINFYLNDAPAVFIRNRSNPLCNVLKIFNGNMAADGKNFTLSETEMLDLVKKYPAAKKFIKNLLGGEELLHSKPRYCLWLVDATISEIKKIPPIFDRVKKVREFRLNSTFKNIADRPHLFRDLKNPKSFIAIPQVSSENRQYIPMDFLDDNFIPTTQLMIIPDADLFYFGVLTSGVHMAWMKTVAGRLKSDFRYSAGVVYNNFVWCQPTPEQRQKIKSTALKILDTRKNYPDATLADLYDDTLMPKDLRDAHKENDAAVMAAYKFNADFTESDIVAELMNLYSLEITKLQ